MPSIINGLFSGRSGISSHGLAIATVGDNISNTSTVGYKRSRAEFEDLVAGGQSSGKVVGSGSSISAVSNIFEQGTLDFTGKELDLGIDGKGYFVIEQNGSRMYTRAGNFKVDEEGNVVTQKGDSVLGFPVGGSGSLEELNVATVSQGANVATQNVTVAGNLDANETPVLLTSIPATTGTPPTTTYAQIDQLANFSNVFTVFDSLGQSHTVTAFFFKDSTAASTWEVRFYGNNEEIDANPTVSGFPRELGNFQMTFGSNGNRTGGLVATTHDLAVTHGWNNGSDGTSSFRVSMTPFTQFATSSGINSITGDGRGVGAITNLSIGRDGQIFALLDNGQSSTIGTVGLANFANAEGLVRVGGNHLQETIDSGAPIIGRPDTGTFGRIESGQLELSTVDIASEFVKLITLQRGFQANSRIITTINQLLNEIIQLA